MANRGALLLVTCAALALAGCGANLYRSSSEDPQSKQVPASELAVQRSHGNDFERLKELWEKRSESGVAKDFAIGPGDVLEISVPAIPELSLRVERVSGEGDAPHPGTCPP